MPAMDLALLHKATVTLRRVLVSGAMYGMFAMVCAAQSATAAGCDHSTVAEAWGSAFSLQAQDFFVALQQVVRDGDRKRFVLLVRYPVHVYGANPSVQIAGPTEMFRRYSSIITPDARKVILSQSPACLFGNGQGVMAADGRIWFQKQDDGKFKIIALNIIRRK